MRLNCLSGFLFLALAFGIRPTYSQELISIILTPYDIVRISVQDLHRNNLLKANLISFKRLFTEEELDRSGSYKSTLIDKQPSYHGLLYPENVRSAEEEFDFNLEGLLLLCYEYTILNPAAQSGVDALQKYDLLSYANTCENCYIFQVLPKANLPDAEKIAPEGSGIKQRAIHEAAMRMSGIIFIDKQNLFIKRHKAKLEGTYSKFGVTATRATLDWEQELRKDLSDIVVGKYAEFMYQVRVLGGVRYYTRKRIYINEHYRLNK